MKTSKKKNKKQPKLSGANVVGFILLALLLISVITCLSSCKTAKPVVENTSSSVEKSIEKDKLTPVAIPGEKTSLKALFECDSLNRVLLINYNELKSKNMNSNFSFANGQLNYSAQTEPDTVFIKSTDRWYYVNTNIKTTITKTVTVTEYKNKFGILDWAGILAISYIAGLIFYRIFKH